MTQCSMDFAMDHEMSGLSLVMGSAGRSKYSRTPPYRSSEHAAALDDDDGVGDGEIFVGEHLVDDRVELVVARVRSSGPLRGRPVDAGGGVSERGRDQRQRGVSHGPTH